MGSPFNIQRRLTEYDDAAFRLPYGFGPAEDTEHERSEYDKYGIQLDADGLPYRDTDLYDSHGHPGHHFPERTLWHNLGEPKAGSPPHFTAEQAAEMRKPVDIRDEAQLHMLLDRLDSYQYEKYRRSLDDAMFPPRKPETF